MTTSPNPPTSSNPRSMRFSLNEVLSGMLASLDSDHFTDDAASLAASFEHLAAQFTLFAPFAGKLDPEAVNKALASMESKAYLAHEPGQYKLTNDGRAHCVSSKRTLFNKADCEQLEAATAIFQA